mgnify:CR=1 FL=1
MELSILCGIRINLILEDVTHSKLVYYTSDENEDLFNGSSLGAGAFSSRKVPPIRENYSNQDVSLVFCKNRLIGSSLDLETYLDKRYQVNFLSTICLLN